MNVFRYYPEELVLVDAPPTILIASVSDNSDASAPLIEQEGEIVWHYPNENYREFFSQDHDEYYVSTPDGSNPHSVTSGNTSWGRVFYNPMNTFEWENANMTAGIIIRHAFTEWLPWKALGPVIKLLDAVVPDILDQKSHIVSANLDLAWNDPLSRFYNEATGEYTLGRPANANMRHYYMVVAGQIPFRCRAFHSDKYTESGYAGNVVMTFAKATGLPRSVGFFRKDEAF